MRKLTTLLLLAAAVTATAPAQAQRLITLPSEAPQNVHRQHADKSLWEKQHAQNTPQVRRANSLPTVADTTFTVPYMEYFDNESDLTKYYTIIDANNDGKTWAYTPSYADHNRKSVRCQYDSKNDANDWLITPNIHLLPGRTYKLAYRAGSSNSFPERLETWFGQGKTVASMTQNLQPAFEIKTQAMNEYTSTVTVPTEGDYNFGFHSVSVKDQLYLYLDSIVVTMDALNSAPDSSTNVKVIPGANGALTATIQFNAPTVNIDGSAVSQIDSIVVSNGNREVGIVTDAIPGQQYNVSDNAASNGYQTYRVVAYTGSNQGRQANATSYIGIDTPRPPQNVRMNDKLTTVGIQWDDVSTTGVHGGYVDPQKVVYHVYNVDDSGFLGSEIDSTTTNSISIDYSNNNTDQGDQSFHEYAVVAKNAAGQSQEKMEEGYGHVFFVTGEPYTLPFTQSWPDGHIIPTTQMWWKNYTGDSEWVNVKDNNAYDGDNGLLRYRDRPGEYSAMGSGKVSLKNAKNPQLVYRYKIEPGSGITLKVQALKPDGTKVDLEVINASTNANDTAWHVSKVKLDQFTNERYVEFIWEAGCPITAKAGLVYVDQVEAVDVQAEDLAVSVSAPTGVKKGQSITANALVTNRGDKTAKNYSIAITANGAEVLNTTVNDSLASYADTTFTVTIPTTSLNAAGSIVVKATVTYNGDIDESNNTASATVNLTQVSYTAPLSADEQNGTVTWTAPGNGVADVTEDFESYPTWSTSFGDWTVVDNNGGLGGTLASQLSYPIESTAFGFAIFDFSKINAQLPLVYSSMKAHSGNQSATAIYNLNYKQQDNWLISPHLSGNAQDITFWVNNFAYYDESAQQTYDQREQYDVLYSTTGTDIADFTAIGNTRTAAGGIWTSVTVSLPAGSRYFAIHQKTPNSQALHFSVDDVKYQKGNPKVIGYNIYRDGELIGTVGADDLTYTDGAAGGNHEYSVTAIYEGNEESLPRKAGTSGIAGVHFDNAVNANAPMYNVAGQRVGSNYRGIVIQNGKKFINK